jgi:hypothetical protein
MPEVKWFLTPIGYIWQAIIRDKGKIVACERSMNYFTTAQEAIFIGERMNSIGSGENETRRNR